MIVGGAVLVVVGLTVAVILAYLKRRDNKMEQDAMDLTLTPPPPTGK